MSSFAGDEQHHYKQPFSALANYLLIMSSRSPSLSAFVDDEEVLYASDSGSDSDYEQMLPTSAAVGKNKSSSHDAKVHVAFTPSANSKRAAAAEDGKAAKTCKKHDKSCFDLSKRIWVISTSTPTGGGGEAEGEEEDGGGFEHMGVPNSTSLSYNQLMRHNDAFVESYALTF